MIDGQFGEIAVLTLLADFLANIDRDFLVASTGGIEGDHPAARERRAGRASAAPK